MFFVAKRHGGASGKSTGIFAKARLACILGGSSGLLSKGGMAAVHDCTRAMALLKCTISCKTVSKNQLPGREGEIAR